MSVIHIKVTKGAGKGDTVAFRVEGKEEILQILPKQGILPEVLISYAVEKLFPLKGAVRLSVEGQSTAFSEKEEIEAQQTEALAEVFGSELWSTQVRDDEFVAMMALICENRDLPRYPLTPEQIAGGRKLLRELSEQWADLAPGASLEVIL